MAKRKAHYGMGSIYLRGRIFWISYSVNGEQQNESSGSTDREEAEALLKKRMGEVADGRALGRSRMVTVGHLLDNLESEYREQDRASLPDLKGKIKRLTERFGRIRAAEFGTDDIRRFKAEMKREDYAPASINRYLEVLKRAFNRGLQHDPPLIGRIPHFELLDEDNTREGFLEHDQYRRLLKCLPEYLIGALIFAYHLGIRKGALKKLRRDQVDWAARVIRQGQKPGVKKVGRVLPIYDDMIPWLEMEMAAWYLTPKCPWLLHRDGHQLADFRKSWATATREAGVPGLLFHDLKRSAIRNMERAGVPRSQAKAITGMKTESIYMRYAIVNEQDVHAAARKISDSKKITAKTTAVSPEGGSKPLATN